MHILKKKKNQNENQIIFIVSMVVIGLLLISGLIYLYRYLKDSFAVVTGTKSEEGMIYKLRLYRRGKYSEVITYKKKEAISLISTTTGIPKEEIAISKDGMERLFTKNKTLIKKFYGEEGFDETAYQSYIDSLEADSDFLTDSSERDSLETFTSEIVEPRESNSFVRDFLESEYPEIIENWFTDT